MKGVIFTLLEDFITETYGAAAYDDILGRCPLHTKEPFIGPGTYKDVDFFAILTKSCERLGVTPKEALHAFGKFCFAPLVAKTPSVVAGHTHPRTFLKTVDEFHRVEVQKLYRGAVTPRVTVVETPDAYVINYHSNRRLCGILTGLFEAAGDHFGVPVGWTKTACIENGAPECSFTLTFGEAKKREAA